jgi:hypothetical protein
MAVPSSGSISLLGICREKQNDDYTDTTAIQGGQGGNVVGGNGTISLESCATSGSNHGPQVVMEATNTSSPSYPNGTTPHAMSEFYSYDHDYAASTTSYRTDSDFKYNILCAASTTTAIYTVGAITNGSTVYTNSTRTSTLGAGKYGWHVNSNSTQSTHRFEADSSGVVSSYASC